MMSWKRALDFLLGQEKHQRMRARGVLLGLAIDVQIFGVASYGVYTQQIEASHLMLFMVYRVLVFVAFFGLIRSGLNHRLGVEPSLTPFQVFAAIVGAVAAYAISGPVRGASMLSACTAFIFAALALTPRQLLSLGIFGIGLYAVVMSLCNHFWPARFPAEQEIMHFLLVTVYFPSVSLIAGQLSAVRHKLHHNGIALKSALERNRQLAVRDDLTGVHNRRHMNELLEAEVTRARRTGRPMAIALLDIDHFKRVNDTFGHAGGDEVLRRFADGAREVLRETDHLGRWGGEEFIIVLPETSVDDATAVLKRVHDHMAQVRFDAIDPALRVTFSAGVAALLPPEGTHEWVERADRAMYLAKQSGRNRTVVAVDECQARPLGNAPSHAVAADAVNG